jgi:hypothetical protein
LQKRQQSVDGLLLAVAEAAAVAAGLGALHDERVSTDTRRGTRLIRRGHRDPRLAARRVQALDERSFGAAEGQRDDRGHIRQQEFDLRVEAVVREQRSADWQAPLVGPLPRLFVDAA